jgi:hypothetical protein
MVILTALLINSAMIYCGLPIVNLVYVSTPEEAAADVEKKFCEVLVIDANEFASERDWQVLVHGYGRRRR